MRFYRALALPSTTAHATVAIMGFHASATAMAAVMAAAVQAAASASIEGADSVAGADASASSAASTPRVSSLGPVDDSGLKCSRLRSSSLTQHAPKWDSEAPMPM